MPNLAFKRDAYRRPLILRWASEMKFTVLTSATILVLVPHCCLAQPFLVSPEEKLQCLPYTRIECGCAIALDKIECKSEPDNSRYHLFAKLSDGAPLWLNLNGRQISVPSVRPVSRKFSFSPGDQWTERYLGDGLSITIHYAQGENTCPKTAPETCEYFDVSALVYIQQGSSVPKIFKGKGTCGC